MKWFKHISDSLDDPFIFNLMTEFGSDGYVVFFGVIEIYSREFSPENGWKLVINPSYFRQKFLISSRKIEKILSKIYKWEIEYKDGMIIIFIPKFKELLDNWTAKQITKTTEQLRSDDEESIQPIKNKEERIKNKEEETDKYKDLSPDASGDCPQQEIINAYHKILPELPKVKTWPEELRKILRTRWREDQGRQHVGWWEDYFLKIRQSEYLMGRVNGFTCDLEWVIRPKNMTKILNGRYHNNIIPDNKHAGIKAWLDEKKGEVENAGTGL